MTVLVVTGHALILSLIAIVDISLDNIQKLYKNSYVNIHFV
jgi:hypothetical protein